MESTMPANATVSAVIRAGPFMSLFFSFRSCVAIAHPQDHAPGSGRENPYPGWPNCTPTALEPTVFLDWLKLSSSKDPRCHQTNSIDTRRMADINHLSHLRKAERVLALQKQNTLRTGGVDSRKPRL